MDLNTDMRMPVDYTSAQTLMTGKVNAIIDLDRRRALIRASDLHSKPIPGDTITDVGGKTWLVITVAGKPEVFWELGLTWTGNEKPPQQTTATATRSIPSKQARLSPETNIGADHGDQSQQRAIRPT